MDQNTSTSSSGSRRRYSWTEETINEALTAITDKVLTVSQASLRYGIPSRTINRRLQKLAANTNINFVRETTVRKSRLGEENEIELVKYIKDLEATGYVHTKKEIRKIAYDFAKKKGLEYHFDQNKLMAGNRWLKLFLRRHPEIQPSDAKPNALNDSYDEDKDNDNDDEDNENNDLMAETENDYPDYELIFAEDTTEEEKQFFMRYYSSVDHVVTRKIHCTVCDQHIGTAPSQESIIRMHPILKVTQCKKCHDFYNSGEFSKGEDGSELYCRWCGQGGEVYCCAKCPFVFCKNCIILNLPPTVINDIEENENWSCFVCAPKIMWHLRAQHWALTNFIEKQKLSIMSKNYGESEFRKLMACDLSTCCGSKSAVKRLKKSTGNVSDSSADKETSLNKKKVAEKKLRKILPKRILSDSDSEDEQSKPKKQKSNDEVVCTPDVLSMLQTENSVPKKNESVKEKKIEQPRKIILQKVDSPHRSQQRQSQVQTTTIRPISHVLVAANPQSQSITVQTQSQQQQQNPPPLIIRNYPGAVRGVTPTVVTRKTLVGPRPPSSASSQVPVYHTINGYRIDLNSAAQHETFRLPNGKLIQVKKQGTGTNTASNQQSTRYSIGGNQVVRTQLNPRSVQQPRTIIAQGNQGIQHISLQQPQLTTIRYSTTPTQNISTNATTITAALPSSNGTILLNGAAVQQLSRPSQIVTPAAISAATATQATSASSSTSTATLTRQFFSATPLGQARTQLQNQIFIAMEICQYLTGKVQSLTNSNAYKSVKNFSDVKDLYIHLSYLFTYAIGRFKGLQDKCLEDMKKIGFAGDADSLRSGQLVVEKHGSDADDDDIEIVEPKTTCIDLDSDDEEHSSPTKKHQQSTKTTENTAKVSEPPEESELLSTSVIPPDISVTITPPLPEESILEVDQIPAVPDLNLGAYLLAGILGADESDDSSNHFQESSNNSSPNDGSGSGGNGVAKKPRKKTTNKPNPHLIKQMEIHQRERVEEIIRQDIKLKSTCSVALEKVDLDEYKNMQDSVLEEQSNEVEEMNTEMDQEENNVEESENNENEQEKDNAIPTYGHQSVDVNKKTEINQKPVVTQDIIDEILEESTEKILQFSKKSSMSKSLNTNEMVELNSENSKDNENNPNVIEDNTNTNVVEDSANTNVVEDNTNTNVVEDSANTNVEDNVNRNEMIEEEKQISSSEQETKEKEDHMDCEDESSKVDDDEKTGVNVEPIEIDKKISDGDVETIEIDEKVSDDVDPIEIDEILTSCMNENETEMNQKEDEVEDNDEDEVMKECINETENSNDKEDDFDNSNSVNKPFTVIDESSNKTQDSLLESVSDATLTDYVTKEDVAELLNSVESCSKYNDECEKNVDEMTSDNFLTELSTDSIMTEENKLSNTNTDDKIHNKNDENNALLDDSTNDTITLRDCLLDCLPPVEQDQIL